jgi:hypothetical protein
VCSLSTLTADGEPMSDVLLCDSCDGEVHLACSGLSVAPEGEFHCGCPNSPAVPSVPAVPTERTATGEVADERAAAAANEEDPAADGAADAANEFEDELEEDLEEVALPTYISDQPGKLGVKKYIARLVRDIGAVHERRKTTQRCGAGGGRVANAPLSGLRGSHDAEADEADAPSRTEESVCVGDHAGALVIMDKRPTLLVCEISKLISPSGANATSTGLTVSEVADARCETLVRPLKSSPLGGLLVFSGEYSASALKVGGPSLQPITLRVESCADGQVKLAADIDTLDSCATMLWLRIADHIASVEALVKAPLAAAHRDAENNILFVTEAGQVRAAPAGARRACPICAKQLMSAGYALLHASYHSVHTPRSLPHAEMCPLCFGPAANCPPFLLKTNTLQPRVICSAYAPSASAEDPERGVKFQAKTLSKSLQTNPSTNRPIVCPACHPNLAEDKHKSPSSAPSNNSRKNTKRPAVWSYNMRAHWARLHASSNLPEGLMTDIKLAKEEPKLLKEHFGP